jgi:hypothetical protein
VTRAEAEQAAQRLAREHPDRETHRFVAREREGVWEVAKVRMPEGMRTHPLKATTEAKPKPAQADDPRPSSVRQIPPFGPGV